MTQALLIFWRNCRHRWQDWQRSWGDRTVLEQKMASWK